MQEPLDVEPADGVGLLVRIAEERQQVQAGQIAGRIIEVDVFTAWIACRDPARVGGREVPVGVVDDGLH